MFIIEIDGERHCVNSLDGYGEAGTDFVLTAEVEGLSCDDIPPDSLWDAVAGEFVTNALVTADQTVGDDFIRKMHSVKQVEAALIASGVALTHGIVVEEAAALSVTPAELATAILAESSADRAAEVERRVTKVTFADEYDYLLEP